MGTPEFARRPLEYLHRNSRHKIAAVVTGPAKQAGRGRKLQPTPVNESAMALGLPVLAPESLKDDSFAAELAKFDADIFVVVAFRILPQKIFEMPRHGSINLHGSLLPKYRGAAPIQWALINGETETGLTAFFLKKQVDTGSVIYQEKIAIEPDETFDELYRHMSELAGPVINRTLDLIESGNYCLIEQDNAAATAAPKIMPDDGLIDWNQDAQRIVNLIRGLSTTPGAFTFFRGRKIKVFRAICAENVLSPLSEPGQIIPDKRRLLVTASDGIVEIRELLVEGKSKMTGEAFLRGYQPSSKDVFAHD